MGRGHHRAGDGRPVGSKPARQPGMRLTYAISGFHSGHHLVKFVCNQTSMQIMEAPHT
jgi:hypothetical protein